MSLKLGHRVTVLSGVSNCRDAGSLYASAKQARDTGLPDLADKGVSRKQFEGMRGEIVQIGYLCLDVKDGQGHSLGEKATEIPAGCEQMVLVDSQVVNGQRIGRQSMREWFLPEEL